MGSTYIGVPYSIKRKFDNVKVPLESGDKTRMILTNSVKASSLNFVIYNIAL